METITTQYEEYIIQLKNLLLVKRISFKKIFKLITFDNVQMIEEYENKNGVISDDIKKIMNCILDELNKICFIMEQKLNDLFWLNYALVNFKEEPQISITKAIKLLKTHYINIFDLVQNLFYKETDFKTLRNNLRKHPELRFPLDIAKKYKLLKSFLIKT